jgi:hypothetical protein
MMMSGRWAAVILGSALLASGCSARSGGVGQVPGSGDEFAPTASESAPASSAVTADSSSVASGSPEASPPPADPEPTSKPTPRPTLTPPPSPSLVLSIGNGLDGTQIRVTPGGTIDTRLVLSTTALDQHRCTIVHAATPDSPNIAASEKSLSPVDVQTVALIDGRHDFRASCPSAAGPLTAETWIVAADGAPERCADWAFPEDPVSISTIDELTAGMVGSWHGCVDTPWMPTYWVDLTFRADGTYSSVVGEVLDSFPVPAVYYGTDADDPDKRWRVDDLQASGLGVGIIDIVFDGDSVNRDPISGIRLMGDQLQFELMHHARYGPLVFQLIRG